MDQPLLHQGGDAYDDNDYGNGPSQHAMLYPAQDIESPPFSLENEARVHQWSQFWSDGLFDCASHGASSLMGICCFGWVIKAMSLHRARLLSLAFGLLVFGVIQIVSTVALLAANDRRTEIYRENGIDAHSTKTLDHKDMNKVKAALLKDTPLMYLLCIGCVAYLGYFILSLYYRTRLRYKYNISSSDKMGDCCIVWWCSPCATCQQYRHILRSTGDIVDIPPTVLQPQHRLNAFSAPFYRGVPYRNPEEYTPEEDSPVTVV